jgi:hypothetical protein
MATNQSVERFRRLTEDLQRKVHEEAVAELNEQAEELAKLIASVAPIYQGPATDVVPGALRQSVRVVPDRSKDTIVRIVAGGATTTRPTVSSGPYDYSRAVEFGTHENAPKPFFFPTYRLRKKSIIAAMKRRITKNVKVYSAESGGD